MQLCRFQCVRGESGERLRQLHTWSCSTFTLKQLTLVMRIL